MRRSAAIVVTLMLWGAIPAAASGGTFVDDDRSIHEGAIEAVAVAGITRGCNPPARTRFCPDDPVTRGEMAAFLVRALGYSHGVGSDVFSDDDDSVFESDIERVAAAGVTIGCNPPFNDRFCPNEPVSRGQMAAFLVRALGYSQGGGSDVFSDDDGSVFESDIERVAAAGVTIGCNPPGNDRFCPDDPVTRGQMATFLARALDLDIVATDGYVTPEDVGVTIGVGVVAPTPTRVVGDQLITRDGTVLENVVVDGCITVEADDVLIRNVVVRCDTWYPVKASDTEQHNGLTFEYSRIETDADVKLFVIEYFSDVVIRASEFVGGDDLVFAAGPIDGFVFTRNYRHDPVGDADSHYDGFQIGEFAVTTGRMEISNNYFESIPDSVGVTDLVFATNFSEVNIEVVGNYIGEHGWYTLRAYNQATLTVEDNVFEAGVPFVALLESPGPHTFGCNRFTDGIEVGRDRIAGDDFGFVGCS